MLKALVEIIRITQSTHCRTQDCIYCVDEQTKTIQNGSRIN